MINDINLIIQKPHITCWPNINLNDSFTHEWSDRDMCLNTRNNLPITRKGTTPTMLTKFTPAAAQSPKLAIIASPAAKMPANPSIDRWLTESLWWERNLTIITLKPMLYETDLRRMQPYKILNERQYNKNFFLAICNLLCQRG